MNIFWVHACVRGLKATYTPLGCCVCMPVPLYTFMFLKPTYKVSIPRDHRPPRTTARAVHVLVDRGFEERKWWVSFPPPHFENGACFLGVTLRLLSHFYIRVMKLPPIIGFFFLRCDWSPDSILIL